MSYKENNIKNPDKEIRTYNNEKSHEKRDFLRIY